LVLWSPSERRRANQREGKEKKNEGRTRMVESTTSEEHKTGPTHLSSSKALFGSVGPKVVQSIILILLLVVL
jgi:hypothetical protein